MAACSGSCSASRLRGSEAAFRTTREIWGDICGWYRLDAGLTDARARLTIGAGAEVFVRGGHLMLRGLSPIPAVYRGFPLQPDDNDDPYVFRIDLSEFGIDTGRIVFSQQPGKGHDRTPHRFLPTIPPEATRNDEPEALGHRNAWRPHSGRHCSRRSAAKQATKRDGRDGQSAVTPGRSLALM